MARVWSLPLSVQISIMPSFTNLISHINMYLYLCDRGLQDAIHASSSQSPPQLSSSSATPMQVPPITAASPAILSNTDPNVSIQSILANSRKESVSISHNGQLPTWSIQSGPSVQAVPHPHHSAPPIASQVGIVIYVAMLSLLISHLFVPSVKPILAHRCKTQARRWRYR